MEDILGIVNTQMVIWFLRPFKILTEIKKFLVKIADEKTSILTKNVPN